MTFSTFIESEDEIYAETFANDIMTEMTKAPVYGHHIFTGHVETDEVE